MSCFINVSSASCTVNLKFSSHSGYFYSASLSALLLRRPSITARHIQLCVKNGTRGVLFDPNILPKKDNRSTNNPPRSIFNNFLDCYISKGCGSLVKDYI